MSTALDAGFLRSGCGEEGLTALCVDLFFREQIVSHDRLPKRCAFGPIVPLNLRKGAASKPVLPLITVYSLYVTVRTPKAHGGI